MTTGGLPAEVSSLSLEGGGVDEAASASLIAPSGRLDDRTRGASMTAGGESSGSAATSVAPVGIHSVLQAVLMAAGDPGANAVLDQTRLHWRMGAWKARRASAAGELEQTAGRNGKVIFHVAEMSRPLTAVSATCDSLNLLVYGPRGEWSTTSTQEGEPGSQDGVGSMSSTCGCA